jgi:5'-phosphate synthase pdxT subunit
MDSRDITIGVLALQGDFEAHQKLLEERLGVHAVLVRSADELQKVDGLIIPGGESTTMGKLLERFGLANVIRERAGGGMPVYGTCAGLILLAKNIEGSDQPRLGLLDVTVARNAFGRQVDSFEADIPIPSLGADPVRGVFIRAPWVTQTGPGVEVLGTFRDRVVAVRHGGILGIAFHPELTDDARMHEEFVKMVRAFANDRIVPDSNRASG